MITIHAARLKPFFADSTYHISPTETAGTDDQEFTIDYISSHRGSPTDLASLEFLIHWLGYDISEASWQPYSTVSTTAALDSYILNTVEQAPNLILLIPKTDRKLIHRVVIDKT